MVLLQIHLFWVWTLVSLLILYFVTYWWVIGIYFRQSVGNTFYLLNEAAVLEHHLLHKFVGDNLRRSDLQHFVCPDMVKAFVAVSMINNNVSAEKTVYFVFLIICYILYEYIFYYCWWPIPQTEYFILLI